MTAPQLALPSGDRGVRPAPETRGAAFAAAVAGVASLAVFGGLVAAYLSARSYVDEWPPEAMTFDYYTATTLLATVLMVSITIEWVGFALRRELRGQMLAALGLTAGLTLAHVNGVWYVLRNIGLAVADGPYAVLAHALLFLALLMAIVAFASILLVGLRAVGNQLSPARHQLLRATALYWHATAVAWTIVWYTLYVSK